jgi:hypothetical protein
LIDNPASGLASHGLATHQLKDRRYPRLSICYPVFQKFLFRPKQPLFDRTFGKAELQLVSAWSDLEAHTLHLPQTG